MLSRETKQSKWNDAEWRSNDWNDRVPNSGGEAQFETRRQWTAVQFVNLCRLRKEEKKKNTAGRTEMA